VEEKLNLLIAESLKNVSTDSRGYNRFEKAKTWCEEVVL